jgi:hypothetical protein
MLVLAIAWVVCCAIFLECAYRAPLMEVIDGWLVKDRRKPGRRFPRGIADIEDYRNRRRGHSRVRPRVPVREATARQLESAE